MFLFFLCVSGLFDVSFRVLSSKKWHKSGQIGGINGIKKKKNLKKK